jgi:hypothetical protein
VCALGFGTDHAIAVLGVHRIKFAQHRRAHVRAPVVQLFFELVFNDLALFFDHQNFLQAGGKFARQLGFERPDHADLVQANPDTLTGGVVQP